MRRSCASCGAEGPWAEYNPPPEPNPATDAAWNRRTPDRPALLEVARRAAACGSGGDDHPSAVAERVVAEYLAEQDRTDAAD